MKDYKRELKKLFKDLYREGHYQGQLLEKPIDFEEAEIVLDKTLNLIKESLGKDKDIFVVPNKGYLDHVAKGSNQRKKEIKERWGLNDRT